MTRKIVESDGWRERFEQLHQELGARRGDLYTHLGPDLRELLGVTPAMEDDLPRVQILVASWLDRLISDFKPNEKTAKTVFLALQVSYNVEIKAPDFHEVDRIHGRKGIAELGLTDRQLRLDKFELRKYRVKRGTSRGYLALAQGQFLPLIESQLKVAGIISNGVASNNANLPARPLVVAHVEAANSEPAQHAELVSPKSLRTLFLAPLHKRVYAASKSIFDGLGRFTRFLRENGERSFRAACGIGIVLFLGSMTHGTEWVFFSQSVHEPDQVMTTGQGLQTYTDDVGNGGPLPKGPSLDAGSIVYVFCSDHFTVNGVRQAWYELETLDKYNPATKIPTGGAALFIQSSELNGNSIPGKFGYLSEDKSLPSCDSVRDELARSPYVLFDDQNFMRGVITFIVALVVTLGIPLLLWELPLIAQLRL